MPDPNETGRLDFLECVFGGGSLAVPSLPDSRIEAGVWRESNELKIAVFSRNSPPFSVWTRLPMFDFWSPE